MQVRTFARTDTACAHLSTPIVSVALMMAERGTRVVPVAEDGRFIGLVTDWDISCRAVMRGMDLENATVRDVMPEGQTRCADTTELEQAVALLDRERAHGLAVYDQEDALVGWVHRDDIAQVAA